MKSDHVYLTREPDDGPDHGSDSTARDAAGSAAPSAPRRWWRRKWGWEVLLVLYGIYDGSRLLVNTSPAQAEHHGEQILSFERGLHLSPEHAINHLFARNAWLGIPADFIYASLHYVITVCVLFWVWRKHRDHYRRARTWLGLTTLLGVVGFVVFPTAAAAAGPRLHRHPGPARLGRLVGRRRRRDPARARRHEQRVRGDAQPARRLGPVVRAAGLLPRPAPAGAGTGPAVPVPDRLRGDGHGQPLPDGLRDGRAGGTGGAVRHRAAAETQRPGGPLGTAVAARPGAAARMTVGCDVHDTSHPNSGVRGARAVTAGDSGGTTRRPRATTDVPAPPGRGRSSR
ncbi:phosphatase PAP2 family protein [Streptacidiphilus sp. 4-A2]|nr:phosphatase PAP2 family protein [Streptacidiphilus sp. 4-A2]